MVLSKFGTSYGTFNIGLVWKLGGFHGDVTTKYGDFMGITRCRIHWDLIGIHCWDLMEINSDNGI